MQPGQPGQAARPAQTASLLSPWASETIGRSSDITSFSMWMKYTLRAEACGGEGKGVLQTFCFQLTQMLGESQRLQHEKKIHCGCRAPAADRNEIAPTDFS